MVRQRQLCRSRGTPACAGQPGLLIRWSGEPHKASATTNNHTNSSALHLTSQPASSAQRTSTSWTTPWPQPSAPVSVTNACHCSSFLDLCYLEVCSPVSACQTCLRTHWFRFWRNGTWQLYVVVCECIRTSMNIWQLCAKSCSLVKSCEECFAFGPACLKKTHWRNLHKLAWKQEMLKRLEKAIMRNLQQLAQEVLKRTTQESPAESSQASPEAGKKTQEDKPAESSEASPWCVESLCIRASKWAFIIVFGVLQYSCRSTIALLLP